MRHAARLVTVVARTCFWLVALHYYGPSDLLYTAAAWMFALGIKDLLFCRLRLRSVRRPGPRAREALLSFGLEGLLLAARLLLLLGVAALLAIFSQTVAAVLSGLMLCHIFWSRETISNLASAYEVMPLRVYVASAAALAGIGTILYCAETGRSAIEAVLAGLVLREAVFFAGMLLAVIAGRLGLRLGGEEADEEEGGALESVIGPEGREIRSTWKLLIADNAVWSRWRLIQFGTRYAASGLLGPFGGFAARILFTYRQPGAYVHRGVKLKAWQLGLALAGTVGMTTFAILLAKQLGLLQALGITAASFLFRLTAIVVNLLLWRQLTPLVGLEGKIPFPPARMFSKKA